MAKRRARRRRTRRRRRRRVHKMYSYIHALPLYALSLSLSLSFHRSESNNCKNKNHPANPAHNPANSSLSTTRSSPIPRPNSVAHFAARTHARRCLHTSPFCCWSCCTSVPPNQASPFSSLASNSSSTECGKGCWNARIANAGHEQFHAFKRTSYVFFSWCLLAEFVDVEETKNTSFITPSSSLISCSSCCPWRLWYRRISRRSIMSSASSRSLGKRQCRVRSRFLLLVVWSLVVWGDEKGEGRVESWVMMEVRRWDVIFTLYCILKWWLKMVWRLRVLRTVWIDRTKFHAIKNQSILNL